MRASIRRWLYRAGIGAHSPKMRHLLQLALDPRTVQAWVLEMEWWQREAAQKPNQPIIGGRTQFTIGTLIRILEDGDPPPPLRCQECLQIDCYCDLVAR